MARKYRHLAQKLLFLRAQNLYLFACNGTICKANRLKSMQATVCNCSSWRAPYGKHAWLYPCRGDVCFSCVWPCRFGRAHGGNPANSQYPIPARALLCPVGGEQPVSRGCGAESTQQKV